MTGHFRANLWLLTTTLVLCCLVYPLVLWGVGQAFFPSQAQGSIVYAADGKAIGSRLIAQPFTGDEYFQPRPSAASYNAAASGASNWAATNYLLRERVARALGPIVRYGAKSPKAGQPVGPDIEIWFRNDRYQGKSGIVAQWAELHASVAQNWVKADKADAAYVEKWRQEHPAEVAQWIKDHPDPSEPKAEDLAVPFFKSYSASYPGSWPSLVAQPGHTEKKMERVREGSEIQGVFFDLWRQEHPDVDLEEVPADLVMASGSGLDPHITLKNAFYQLDRVAGAWAVKLKANKTVVRQQIEKLLQEKEEAPLGGLVGVPLVNVLEVNLALPDKLRSLTPGG